MSTWTFDQSRVSAGIGLGVAVALSACAGGVPSVTKTRATEKTTISVSGQDTVIAGPPGFCVDQEATRQQTDNAFVLLGNCAVIGSSAQAQPQVRALLTASVSGNETDDASISNSLDGLDQFFRSDDGRAALSRDSDPETVEVLDTFQTGDTFYIRARDTSDGIVPQASDEYWRAYFDMQDQIVSVSVIGFDEAPLEPEVSLETLRAFSHSIKINNGVDSEPPPTTSISDPVYIEDTSGDDFTEVPPSGFNAIREPLDALYKIGLIRRLIMN